MAYSANIPKSRRIANQGGRVIDGARKSNGSAAREGISDNNNIVIQYITGDPVFLSIDDVVKKTGWSTRTVQRLFNAPDFPSTDLGKKKLVLASALATYFSIKRERCDYDGYWD